MTNVEHRIAHLALWRLADGFAFLGIGPDPRCGTPLGPSRAEQTRIAGGSASGGAAFARHGACRVRRREPRFDGRRLRCRLAVAGAGEAALARP
ncbi:MAG: hypothetical protein AVDCRST_MAG91-3499 [uncultured Sphingomonadaceae bacterium]|uniref:Uncharacterized protein n=1 Tax=uncultured Sphingomonadaceae bacterium TaxID=169976 RepID=A0A6J4U0I3_9SPHN|nr:MAG: hypothetical protein AVDCRST_MAG91-3499 [uncultured Sphingomonadaceae bacterium]